MQVSAGLDKVHMDLQLSNGLKQEVKYQSLLALSLNL